MKIIIKKILGVILLIHLLPLIFGLIGFLSSLSNPGLVSPFWVGFVFGYFADIFVAILLGLITLLFWLFDA